MKNKSLEITWYVEPIDQTTNDAIARYLSQEVTESAQEGITVSSVGKVNAYEVPYSTITQLSHTKFARYRIYKRVGNGPIYKFSFASLRKKNSKTSSKATA